jgi:hypothetical protein
MEELIMSNPHNHLFYQKFAEVRNIMKKIPHRLYGSNAMILLKNCRVGVNQQSHTHSSNPIKKS